MVFILNWRDVQPKIAHMSAVHWGGFRDRERNDDPDERNRLQKLQGFARHALQGRKTSDHHKHENLEQVYYVLSGRGEVLFGEERFPVQDGDAIYLPPGVHHQMFNDMNQEWLEHHVISQQVEGNGGEFAIRNWRDSPPAGDGQGAVRWHQLGRLLAAFNPSIGKPCSLAARPLNDVMTIWSRSIIYWKIAVSSSPMAKNTPYMKGIWFT